MKILFSLTYYTPYVSGLTLYVKRLAEALARKNYQVTVLTMQYDKKMQMHEFINKVRVERASSFGRISKGFLSFDWVLKSFQEVLKNEVIIINLPQFEAVSLALLAKVFGKKLITIYHCEVDLPKGLANRIVEMFLSVSHFMTLWLSESVVTYTEDFGRHSKLLPFFSDKVQCVYPPMKIPKAEKRIQKVFRGKIGATDYVIGVAARLAAEKGMEYLLESIPILSSKLKTQSSKTQFKAKNFKIIIAGSMEPVGEENYKRKILKLVEKYKEYVVFLGELKEEEMGSFYTLLDVLVLPSVNSTESFGMVQVEAMMMGVPVIATDLPGVRIPVGKTGMGRIVPIRNSEKLAEATVEVLRHKNKYIKDTSLIKKEFSFKKTISFYTEKIDSYSNHV